MTDETIPPRVSAQLSQAVAVIQSHLAPGLVAVHLYGSALDGGLKRFSDIDLLVTVSAPLDESLRRALVTDLLQVSAFPGESEVLRALEVTVLVRDEVIPWRHPAKRELQFGEWQREDICAGVFEPVRVDPDLAVLLTQVRQHGVALIGPEAERLFQPVPHSDLFNAFAEALKMWNAPMDWEGDERNVMLTLTRIWYSAQAGEIVPKDVAADWAMERLPIEHRSVLLKAREAYLGRAEDVLALHPHQVTAFVRFVKREGSRLLNTRLVT